MKPSRPRSVACALLLASAFLVAPAQIHAGSPDSSSRSVAVLDALLQAHAARGDHAPRCVDVGCQGFSPAYLRAWRDRLAQGNANAARTKSANADTGRAGETSVAASAFGSVGEPQLWPGGVVPYEFDPAITPVQQQAFIDAAGDWSAFANVAFVPRTTQTDYVVVQPYAFSGGRADLGRIGGAQLIEINDAAWNRGTLLHEMGHCLGLIHEHQRPDRDTFVVVQWANVAPGAEGNFILLPSAVVQGAYDFESVMHYARDALAASDGLDTLVPQPAHAAWLEVMGRNVDRPLSALDRSGLAAVYGAPLVAPGAVVTNTRDSGAGSLRAAIYYAWDHPGTTVTFAIPTSDPGFDGSVFTIHPTDVLTRPGPSTTLDASTQPGNSNPAGPEIVLRGDAAAAPFVDGLHLHSTGCVVRGFVIRDFGGTGVSFAGPGSSGNTVAGCYIGTDHTGTLAAANTYGGVTLRDGAKNNVVGGATPAAANVISGNQFQGVYLSGSGTTGNTIAGNRIGLAASGAVSLPNTFSGVGIFAGAAANVIGGGTTGARNVISGNALQGIFVSDAGTADNRIEGNFLGTDPAGNAPLPNGWAGVEVAGGATGTRIGGTTAGTGNVISGNGTQGVFINGGATVGTRVEGNTIGLNAAGTAAVPNTWSGVDLYAGASGTVIGGMTSAARNVISGNKNHGVIIQFDATGTQVLGNRIGTSASGLAAIGNLWSGVVLIGDTTDNVIGGSTAGAGNVISGNLGSGVELSGGNVAGNTVAGNTIGLDAAGTGALPNGWTGVVLGGGANANVIGGTTPGTRNVIAGNGGYGVALFDPPTVNNAIRGNWIGLRADGIAAGNGASGVGLWNGAAANTIGGGSGAGNVITASGWDGVSVWDVDTVANSILGNQIFGNAGKGILLSGGNEGRAAPTLATATLGTTLQVTGMFAAPVLGGHRLEFFATSTPDGSGAGEGRYFLGGTNVNATSDPAAFVLNVATLIPAGQTLSATVTDPDGNTSEFAVNRTVVASDTDADGLPDSYESAQGFNPLVADSGADTDGDGQSNLAEFYSGTNPKSAASRLGPLQISYASGAASVTLPAAVVGKTYRLETRDLLESGAWRVLASGLYVVSPGAVAVTDAFAASKSRAFYRAVVEAAP